MNKTHTATKESARSRYTPCERDDHCCQGFANATQLPRSYRRMLQLPAANLITTRTRSSLREREEDFPQLYANAGHTSRLRKTICCCHRTTYLRQLSCEHDEGLRHQKPEEHSSGNMKENDTDLTYQHNITRTYSRPQNTHNNIEMTNHTSTRNQ